MNQWMPLSVLGNAKSNLRLIIFYKQSMLLQKSNKACVIKNCTNKSLHHVKPFKREKPKLCRNIFAFFLFCFVLFLFFLWYHVLFLNSWHCKSLVRFAASPIQLFKKYLQNTVYSSFPYKNHRQQIRFKI